MSQQLASYRCCRSGQSEVGIWMVRESRREVLPVPHAVSIGDEYMLATTTTTITYSIPFGNKW
jgi:hypothetical protein